MTKVIKVIESEDWWECGDGCCSQYECISVFHLDGTTHEYTSHDHGENLKRFVENHFNVEFEIEYEDKSRDDEEV